MTDQAHPASDPTSSNPPMIDARVPVLHPGLLELTGNIPVAVWVEVFPSINGRGVPGFACHPSGPYFADGLQWMCNHRYSMFVTFHYSPKVTSIAASLPRSEPFGTSPVRQDICIPYASQEVTYSFVVVMHDDRHDPKIVVTPIDSSEGGTLPARA